MREAPWSAPVLWRFVLGMVLGKDLKSAQAAASTAAGKIYFEGAHFRRDIAAKAFLGKKSAGRTILNYFPDGLLSLTKTL